MEIDYFDLAALFALGVLGMLLFLVLFEPGLAYKIDFELPAPDSENFSPLLAAVIDEPALEILDCEVLRNGAVFYPAELAAIASAKTSIHLEAFIFHATPIGERFVSALAERARAGIKVRVIVDAVGSMLTPNRFFDRLRAAGGDVAWYQPLRWYTLKRFNNRTHRELLIIDGRTAFIGGAGIGTAWDPGEKGRPPWRDTVVRVAGPTAAAVQTVFVENWLESSGEVLADETVFPIGNRFEQPTVAGERLSLVAGSSPTGGRGTRARVLFQLLIAAARTDIRINSPYFLPDRAMRRELLKAAARGVKITVVVPGKHNNHVMARYASRRLYGELLSGGIAIYEYQPGMIHAKILIVDHLWSVVGSTNFDNRSFGLNDEVNLASRDRNVSARLAADCERDLQVGRLGGLGEGARGAMTERMLATIGR
ncbi:MAG TPA: phospholipase D-like domain-containing protein, partial [Burkholderiaceae bacterium]|nr:phospholipase D-like domain-containing protein [Burkholderiaceae bacterium]